MLYSLLISLVDEFSILNVFRYLTFRTGLSVMSSMIIVFLVGGPFIRFIGSRKITGPIREDGPIDHIIKKVGTPTMGGVLILIGLFIGVFLWADLYNPYNWILIFSGSRKSAVLWVVEALPPAKFTVPCVGSSTKT